MNLSNVIAEMISDMLEKSDEIEIQRNTLAQNIGCVPSQINYVLSSRFTPEKGYIVESKRGGGGCIRITRISYDKDTMLMHVVNSVGNEIDEKTCRSHVLNLHYRDLLSEGDARIILAATGDSALRSVPPENRDMVRASIFKQILLAVVQNS
ncbi:MAG: CtsR family transcriptional regulator [Acutalibacteraceae bacterium]